MNGYDGVAPRSRSAKRLCTFQDREPMPSTKDAEDVETVYDEYTVYSGDINSL
jgi:hypothetical protein